MSDMHTPAPSYDDIFPALPEAEAPMVPQWTPPPRVAMNGSATGNAGTKKNPTSSSSVHRVAPENRKFQDPNNREQNRIIKDIMQRTSTGIEVSSLKDGTLTFFITGKDDAIQQAKRLIGTELQQQATATVPIPKDHHKFILGKAGKKLQELETLIGVKINVPRQNEDSNLIKIVGPREAIAKAVHEIQIISNEIDSRANERLNIEKEYHAFISGPFGEVAKEISDQTGVKINIPPLSVNKNEISISGEKEGVRRARDKIMLIYEEKKKNCKSVYVEVKKQQHRYVIGPKGQTLQEIFKKTGVSIEMPPTDNPSETIRLRGDQENLSQALGLVYEKAHSEIDEELDAPSWIQRYIIGPKGVHFQEISRDFQATVNVSFSSNDNKIKIHGPKKDVEIAKTILEGEIRRVKRDVSIYELTVDSKYHRFVIGKSGQTINQIRTKTGAQINVPTEGDGALSNIIRIEGRPEEVNSAREEIEAIIKKRQETESNVSKDLIIEQRFHKQIIGSKGEKIKEIRDRFNQVVITFPESSVKSDKVAIRGPKEDVDSCTKYLAQLNTKLVATNHRAEVPIFKEFHKFIIGKKGAEVRELMDKYDVQITVPPLNEESDVILVTGTSANVDRVKQELVQRADKLKKEKLRNYKAEITVDPQYHPKIIGKKGGIINKIRAKHDVQIQFPERAQAENDSLITIVGVETNALAAKEEILKLVDDLQNQITIEVSIDQSVHPRIIGARGKGIAAIMDKFNVQITVPPSSEESDLIRVTGTPEATELAKQELLDRVDQIEKEKVDRELRSFKLELNIDPVHHPKIIGKRGFIINKIRTKHEVQIQFPERAQNGAETDESLITIVGYEANAIKAKEEIEKIVGDLENQITVELSIDPRVHSRIIGSRGKGIGKIMDKYKVNIKFPKSTDENKRLVLISGSEENAEAAKDHVLNLEEEYLDDCADQYLPPRPVQQSERGQLSNGNSGFQVHGAPWEKPPDTNNTEEFPSMASDDPGSREGSSAPWGPRIVAN